MEDDWRYHNNVVDSSALTEAYLAYVETTRQKNNRISYQKLVLNSKDQFIEVADIKTFQTPSGSVHDEEVRELREDIKSAYDIIQTQQLVIEKLENAYKF